MMHQVFRGRTLDEAKQAAVTTLGSRAVIVATRKVTRTGIAGMLGGHEFEIAATPADEEEPPTMTRARRSLTSEVARRTLLTEARRSMTTERDAERPFSEGAYEESEAPTTPGPTDELAKLRSELKAEIRAVRLAATRVPAPTVAAAAAIPAELITEIAHLRAMMDEMLAPAISKKSKLGQLLDARGIEGASAVALIRRLKSDVENESVDLRERLRDAAAEEIRVMPWPVAHEGRAVVAMVGPAGVGKTTTAAKLAAHAIRSGKSVTLVGADAFRVGAANQLQRYAELLGAQFEVAATAGELARVLAHDTSDLVIVDTSGQAMPEPNAPESFIARSSEGEGLDGRARYVLLCVPAAIRAADARRVASRYGALGPTGLVVTKLDETDAPAGLLHASHATRLPTSVLCFGPQVPDAIAPASRGAVLDHLIPLSSRKESGR